MYIDILQFAGGNASAYKQVRHFCVSIVKERLPLLQEILTVLMVSYLTSRTTPQLGLALANHCLLTHKFIRTSQQRQTL